MVLLGVRPFYIFPLVVLHQTVYRHWNEVPLDVVVSTIP